MEANKQQLIEIKALRKRVAELEKLEVEHKKRLKPQKDSEEKYRKIFEICPIGITILDMKGMILYCNNAVYTIGGYTEDDLVGKHFSKIAPLNVRDVPKFLKIFNSIIRGEVPKPFEISYQRKDGSTGWTEIYISLYKVDGMKLEIQVLQHDITDRNRTEEELKEKMYKLELFNKIAVDRELRMVELKKEINSLLERAGETKKYMTSL